MVLLSAIIPLTCIHVCGDACDGDGGGDVFAVEFPYFRNPHFPGNKPDFQSQSNPDGHPVACRQFRSSIWL